MATSPASQGALPARSWVVATVVAAVLIALCVQVVRWREHGQTGLLPAEWSAAISRTVMPLRSKIAVITARLLGVDVAAGGTQLTVGAPHAPRTINLAPGTAVPLTLILLSTASIAAAILWRMDKLRGPLVVLLGIALGLLLPAVIGGLVAGFWIGLGMRDGLVFLVIKQIGDGAIVLSAMIMAALWVGIDRLIIDDAPAVQPPEARPPPAVLAVAMMLALLFFLAMGIGTLGLLVDARFRMSTSTFQRTYWIAASMMAALGALAAGWLMLLGIVKASPAARWAWAPLLLLLPQGGEGFCGGLLFLLTVIAVRHPCMQQIATNPPSVD